MRLPVRPWLKLRSTGSASRRARRCAKVELSPLEGRLLLAADVTPPVTTAAVVDGTLGKNGFYKTPITIDLTAVDSDSPDGIKTFFKVDDGTFEQGDVVKLGDGIHTLRFYSVDENGNREDTNTQTFKVDTTVPVVHASASRTSLWPPNHKFITITVSGRVTDASGGVPTTVRFHVIDEYGNVQPAGRAHVNARGRFSFPVSLQSSRLGQDKDGRHYTIVVTATDQAGNRDSTRVFVVVPHDQGHRGGGGGGGGGKDGGGFQFGGRRGQNDQGFGHFALVGNDHGKGNNHGKGNTHGHGNGNGHGQKHG